SPTHLLTQTGIRRTPFYPASNALLLHFAFFATSREISFSSCPFRSIMPSIRHQSPQRLPTKDPSPTPPNSPSSRTQPSTAVHCPDPPKVMSRRISIPFAL